MDGSGEHNPSAPSGHLPLQGRQELWAEIGEGDQEAEVFFCSSV